MSVATATLTHNSGFKTTCFSCCNVYAVGSQFTIRTMTYTYKSFLSVCMCVCVSGVVGIMKHLTVNMRGLGLVRFVVEFCFESAESRIPSCDLLRRLIA